MSTPGQRVFSKVDLTAADDAPLYMRIKKIVQDAKSAGDLREGDAMPSERDVAELLHVSRVTVRKAFSELVREGSITQKRGSGTYVGGQEIRLEQPLSRLTSFTQDMTLRGLSTRSEVLSQQSAIATPEEALKLSLSPTERVSRWKRLRFANDVPMALEHAVFPERFLPDASAVHGSLYAALDAGGFRPVRALQRLHAVALDEEEALLLGVATASPALRMERISYLADGRVVEFTTSYYRGDLYDFVAELTLVQDQPQ
ncbi:GntR family transcriptional regulator [Aestuariivirga litoralis]|uniref:GntR family transcriptional regulator n=1 Tax=Aestuariivirga litoralis TaxID=2650924 RepID=UPI0018C6DD6E|nr:GntR family transcriptional regulator [Aestuariivirga litoralis]MBG1233872.1 GntR family transcriptional regulator [Aestuariivirga litoralis]